MKNKALICVLLFIILAGVGVYLYQNLERTEITIPAIPRGEALTNDYYAAGQLMQRLGYSSRQVADSRELINLPVNSTLVLTGTDAVDNRDRKNKAALVDWVRRGGHVLIDVSRRDVYQRDEAKQDDYGPTLLDSLGVTPLRIYERPCNNACRKQQQARRHTDDQYVRDTDKIQIEGHPLRVDLEFDAVAFELKTAPQWQVQLPMFVESEKSPNDDEEQSAQQDKKDPPLASYTVIARFREGDGWVTVANTDLFQNRTIKDDQNAELFVRLATLPGDKRPLYFAQRTDYPSLPGWLWQNASGLLLALLLLTVLVLWRVMPRFGPLLPPLPSDRPGLRAHLRAVGDFHMRYQDYDALLLPLREEVERALLPMRAHYPDIDSMPRLAAHVSRMTLNEVGDAMTRPARDKAHFVLQVRVLTILLDTLQGMNGKR